MVGLQVPMAALALLAAVFMGNEWSHGSVSETVGAGHHHMYDYGGYHCASHDDAAMGAAHLGHMHNSTQSMPHGQCPGGNGMHDDAQMGGRMGGGSP